jgi:cytochrome c oxidase subunit 4
MALLALTAITVAAAGIRFDPPAINVVVALGIASLKASLVAMFFMHLLHDKPMNALIFVSGLVFLAVFLMFCLIDVDTRLPVRPAQPVIPHPAF